MKRAFLLSQQNFLIRQQSGPCRLHTCSSRGALVDGMVGVSTASTHTAQPVQGHNCLSRLQQELQQHPLDKLQSRLRSQTSSRARNTTLQSLCYFPKENEELELHHTVLLKTWMYCVYLAAKKNIHHITHTQQSQVNIFSSILHPNTHI